MLVTSISNLHGPIIGAMVSGYKLLLLKAAATVIIEIIHFLILIEFGDTSFLNLFGIVKFAHFVWTLLESHNGISFSILFLSLEISFCFLCANKHLIADSFELLYRVGEDEMVDHKLAYVIRTLIK